MRKSLLAILFVVLAAMVGITLYNWLGPSEGSNEISIEKDQAESLDVEIDFSIGNLVVAGGATEWVDGQVDTNLKKGYPSVTYKNKRQVGSIEIQQKKKTFTLFQKQRNDWDLLLTNDVPVSLDIDTGISDSNLNLSGIQLSHLSVDAGVGDTSIDLSGEWKESFEVDVDLGVGDADIHLPKGTGVKLIVSKGIGKVTTKDFISQGEDVYVNEAYGQSDMTITIEVDIGVGKVDFLLVD